MGIYYMGGRQIFESPQEVHKREEDNKSNNRLIDKLLIQMSLLGEVPLERWGDIEIYNWNRQTLLLVASV
jgi:hypothetical protein